MYSEFKTYCNASTATSKKCTLLFVQSWRNTAKTISFSLNMLRSYIIVPPLTLKLKNYSTYDLYVGMWLSVRGPSTNNSLLVGGHPTNNLFTKWKIWTTDILRKQMCYFNSSSSLKFNTMKVQGNFIHGMGVGKVYGMNRAIYIHA